MSKSSIKNILGFDFPRKVSHIADQLGVPVEEVINEFSKIGVKVRDRTDLSYDQINQLKNFILIKIQKNKKPHKKIIKFSNSYTINYNLTDNLIKIINETGIISKENNLEHLINSIHNELLGHNLDLFKIRNQLLFSTRKPKLQKIIHDRFELLLSSRQERIKVLKQRSKSKSTLSSNSSEVSDLKNITLFSNSSSDDESPAQKIIRELDEEKERVEKAVKRIIHLSRIAFTENEDDVLHRK